MDYEANSDNEVRAFETTTDYIEGRTFSVLKITNSANSLNGYYKKAQLYKTTVTDDDGNKTIEFKNGRGQVIMTRRVLSPTENADTYFIFNEYNQLAFVIPPKPAEALKSLASGATVPDNTLNDLCYQFRYDGWDNIVEKKLPTKGWEYMVYDKAERLVATQDAVMKTQGKWMIFKYEIYNRVAYTGIITAGDRQTLQTQVKDCKLWKTETVGL